MNRWCDKRARWQISGRMPGISLRFVACDEHKEELMSQVQEIFAGVEDKIKIKVITHP